MPLRTSYAHLNTIQKGSFAEAYAKMAFTLEGFEVYSTEYDDRGVDFVIRNRSGKYYSVQVKATDRSANPFIYKSKFSATDDFLMCAVRLIEGEEPIIYLALCSDWDQNHGCLQFNQSGGNAGPYYEMRFAAKYERELSSFVFDQYADCIRG